MTISLCNDVIREVHLLMEKDESLSLVIEFRKSEEPLKFENISTYSIKDFLKFCGKDVLSDIKNFPVRVVGEIVDEDKDLEINTIEFIAIGDYLLDSWFTFDMFGQEQILSFEEMFDMESIEIEIDI